MSPDLQSLCKLALVLYPTNSLSTEKPLLLYSSVVGEDAWHLSLIGPAVPERESGPQETWWESKWNAEDLQKLAPSQLLIEIIKNIQQSFAEDDIALRGYRQGNENTIRLTMRCSIPELAFDVPLTQLSSNNTNEFCKTFTQKPVLNLLEIVCEACQKLKKLEKNAKQAQLNRNTKCDTDETVISSSSNQPRMEAGNMTGKNIRKKVIVTSSQDLLSRNLANPCKKPRKLVADGFLSSDDSS